jgi:hypothetical protein
MQGEYGVDPLFFWDTLPRSWVACQRQSNLLTSLSRTDRFAVFRLIEFLEKICCLRYSSTREPDLNQYEFKLCDFNCSLRLY